MRIQSKRSVQKGNALVEFALAVTFLVPLMIGLFQFGYGFYTYNKLIAAVRQGGRYASLRSYDSATTTPSTGYLADVRNATVYGDPAGGAAAVVSGLTTNQVSVNMSFTDGVPDVVTVALGTFTIDTIVARLTFSNKPAAAFRFEGRFAP